LRRSPALLAACCVALLPLFTVPASAAQPGNDVSLAATPATLGFSQDLNTTDATTDQQDAALGATCSGPAGPAGVTDASVWYSFTATSDSGVMVDVSGSDYSAGAYVATGTPGDLNALACGPQRVAFSARAGDTYLVVAFDDQGDGGGNGGTLRIAFSEAPPAPTLDVSIDHVGSFDAGAKAVTVTGTFACTGGEFVQLIGAVNQQAGRVRTTGFFQRNAAHECDGTPHRWKAVVRADAGGFGGEKASAVVMGISCDRLQCGQEYSDQTVRLRGGQH
jgi:hypothetical protein